MSIDQKVVNTIRILSAEQVQAAKSGHPGAPMGIAPTAYALWDKVMKYNPADPKWVNRDRYVLSGGHGSALLYTLFHLYGVGGMTIEDLKQFRQLGSKCPGHPEYGHTVGVETTTGPLGQGVANAVGFAMAEKHIAAHFNREGFPVMDHYPYVTCGDGDMMEGISHEAASLAGTLELGKLICIYDKNGITIEGSTDIAFRENVGERFDAYGWQVIDVADGNDWENVYAAIEEAKKDPRPSLIIAHTIIGFGCPAKQGTASAHGEPLGPDNLAEAKKNLGMPAEDFFVEPEVYAHTAETAAKGAKAEKEWEEMFAAYAEKYPELAAEWKIWFSDELPCDLLHDDAFWAFEGSNATRNTSGEALNRLAAHLPNLFGGSADLCPSNKSNMKNSGYFSAETPEGNNIHFGIREHAMSAICNAMALHGGLRAYAATFFCFSDYMKNGMRLSAMMKQKVAYILTHDSIGVGEDGPTHQPVEHLAGLRAIPNLLVFRPADGKETAAAWYASQTDGRPTCIVSTRQNLPTYNEDGREALKGGYILSDCEGTPDVLLMASGSEVEQMMAAQPILAAEGIKARVISMPCMELFDEQSAEYRESVMPSAVRARVSMEAGVTMPWYKYVGMDGKAIGIDTFGASGPYKKLFPLYGITTEHVVEEAKKVLGK